VRRTGLALLFLAACQVPQVAGPEAPAQPEEPSAAVQPLWQNLFDGQDLQGWTAKIRGYPAGEDPLHTFRVRDGVIAVDYGDYGGAFQERFGHLFHDIPYTDYRLRVEYRFLGEQLPDGPGWAYRNSGLMIHGQSAASMSLDQDFPVSIEVQLLGGDGTHPRANANLCTPGTNVVMDGALLRRHCTDSTSATYPGDDWVTVEVEVHGSQAIRHFLDGQEVLFYQQPQLDDRDPNAQRLIPASGSLLLDHGTLSLQSESHPVEFRRVELLPLTAEG